MELLKGIKTLGGFVADLVFPVYCLVCGTEGLFLCANCQTNLPTLERQLCIVCKKPAPYGKTHPDCVSRNTVDGIVSALSYTQPNVKKLIGTFKYQFIHDLAPHLSQMIVQATRNQELGNYFSDFTLIPVPLHKRRYNWRGFNQAELIGQALAADLNIPFDKELVARTRFTKPQVDLKADHRRSNIENAFTITSDLPAKKFLLVDDVITTGSTLNEIAKLLKKNGATEVWAATIAHG